MFKYHTYLFITFTRMIFFYFRISLSLATLYQFLGSYILLFIYFYVNNIFTFLN
jgi:hypothetical protein